MTATRRYLLGWVGVALGLAGAGCGGDDPPPGLYASRTQLVYQPGDDRYRYPEDIGVRVTVENTSSQRREGVLETTLEELDDSEGTPAAVESWSREQSVSMSGGTTRGFFHVFEAVVGDGQDEDSFRARASV